LEGWHYLSPPVRFLLTLGNGMSPATKLENFAQVPQRSGFPFRLEVHTEQI